MEDKEYGWDGSSSVGLVLHEVVDHLKDGLAGPLGGHVAHTLHGHEVEHAVVLLDVAGNLLARHPGVPRGRHVPVQVHDPALGAVGRH